MPSNELTATSVTVLEGTIPTQIVLQRPDRIALHIWHVGQTTVHVLPFPEVAAGRGIVLEPGDYPIIYRQEDDPELAYAPWWAIAPSGDVKLLIMEVW